MTRRAAAGGNADRTGLIGMDFPGDPETSEGALPGRPLRFASASPHPEIKPEPL
jgi:hypothetical protein